MHLCHLLLLLLLLPAAAIASSSNNIRRISNNNSNSNNSSISNNSSNNTTPIIHVRVKRNKFVKKFIEKSKASQEKVRELESRANTQNWPVIAWKTNKDVFNIGDDGQMETSPFEAISEEDATFVTPDASDFSLQPASSYKGQLEKVRSRIGLYNNTFLAICVVMCLANFALFFIRFWLVALSRVILRAGFKIEFPGTDGPLRQEFIYAMAYAVEDDLLDYPATRAEQGFAACINDVVVAVESYTKNRS